MYTIIIPCYNEEKTIKLVLDEIQRNYNFQIIVVDNGSTDGSKDIITSYKNIDYIYANLKGKGNAILAAIPHVKHDTVILIDADNEYPADQIQLLISEITNKKQMLIGVRPKDKMLKSSLIANFLIQLILKLKYKQHIEDCLTGLRIIPTKILSQLKSKDFSVETELNIRCLKNNILIKNVPIEYTPRIIGKKIKFHDMFSLVKVAMYS